MSSVQRSPTTSSVAATGQYWSYVLATEAQYLSRWLPNQYLSLDFL
jgi:hypothetical protein